ncbi:MAG: hypothetical protein ACPK7O_09090 [Methanobacterium sp.]
MNTKKLEADIKRLEKRVKNLTIDFDDPEYAIYKIGKWEKCTFFLFNNMYKKKPVNKTARDYELERTGYFDPDYKEKHKGTLEVLRKNEEIEDDDEALRNTDAEEILKVPIETKKQIQINNSDYLIYKLDPEIKGKYKIFRPHNKAAREYEHKYGRPSPQEIKKRTMWLLNECEKKASRDK